MAWARKNIADHVFAYNTTVTPPMPTYSVGDLLLLFAGQFLGSVAPPDLSGQGWTRLSLNSSINGAAIYGRIATGSGDQPTYQWTSGVCTFGCIASYTGNPSTLTGIAGVAGGEVAKYDIAADVPYSGIGAPSVDHCLMVSFGIANVASSVNGGVIYTASPFTIWLASFDQIGASHIAFCIQDYVQGAKTSFGDGANNGSWSDSGVSYSRAAQTIALKPASGIARAMGDSVSLSDTATATKKFSDAGGPNGGFTNTDDVTGLDPTKTYRVSVWCKNSNSDLNPLYFGCHQYFTNDLVTRNSGLPNFDPFFFSGVPPSLQMIRDQWYLWVGIIHGMSYVGADSGMSGVWNPLLGQRVYAGKDFRMLAGGSGQGIRAFCKDGGNTGQRTVWCKPRFEAIDGNEPSITTMLSPKGALAYLDVVNTDGLTVNAATNLFMAGYSETLSGQASASLVPSGHFPHNLLLPVNVYPPDIPKYDCTVIVTFVANMAQLSGNAGDMLLEVAYSDAGYDTNGSLAVQYSTAQLSIPMTTPAPIMHQWEFQHVYSPSVNANTAFVSVYDASGTADWFQLHNGGVVQMEYIKR